MPDRHTPPVRHRRPSSGIRLPRWAAMKRLALALAGGGTASAPVWLPAMNGHSPSAGAVFASSLVTALIALISVASPRLVPLLWTLRYSRMLGAVVHKGIALARDTDDICRLMTALCDASASIAWSMPQELAETEPGQTLRPPHQPR